MKEYTYTVLNTDFNSTVFYYDDIKELNIERLAISAAEDYCKCYSGYAIAVEEDLMIYLPAFSKTFTINISFEPQFTVVEEEDA